ncbi:MAG: TraR/DksA C4-type zinc finger protein [Candidatus Kapaibacterium sp.]|nr:hypothetical protein [Candidatus Kapabacteria bacterium]
MAKKTVKDTTVEQVEVQTANKTATDKGSKVKTSTKNVKSKTEAKDNDSKSAKSKAVTNTVSNKDAVKSKKKAPAKKSVNNIDNEVKLQKDEAPESEQNIINPEAELIDTPLNESVSQISDSDIRYSDDDLEMFAEVINEAKSEALDELRMLKERLEDLTAFDSGEESMIYSMHMAEQGSEAQEKEKTYAQIQRISEHIKKLEDAMDRIRNKTYGICRVCGCLIAKERLLAVPVTTLSASYKIHSKCPEDGVDKIEPVRF